MAATAAVDASTTFLTATEVAQRLHVSPKTVSRSAKDGKLPCFRTLGGHRRYPGEAIDQLALDLQFWPHNQQIA